LIIRIVHLVSYLTINPHEYNLKIYSVILVQLIL
jgi:hypothetical protein